MQVTCNSGFLPLGVEMHLFFVTSRHSFSLPLVIYFRLFPLVPGSRFPAFPGSRVFLVLRFPGVVPVLSLYGISAWPTRPGTGPRGPR